MTDEEKLTEIVRKAAKRCLPSNTEEFHVQLLVTDLLVQGVTVRKRKRKMSDDG